MLKLSLLLLSIFFSLFFVINIICYIRVQKWIVIDATIRDVHIGLKSVLINFIYIVDLQTYEQVKTFSFYSNSEARFFAKQNNLSKGNKIEIFYNPNDPDSIVMDKGFNQFNRFSVKIILYLMFASISFILYYKI